MSTDTPTFVKHDDGKPRMSLVPPRALLEMARVLTAGAAEYGDENWHRCPDLRRYVDATLRHINAYQSGEVADPKTGRHHLAHAATSLMFIVELELRGGAL